jgi:hypothetical protein
LNFGFWIVILEGGQAIIINNKNTYMWKSMIAVMASLSLVSPVMAEEAVNADASAGVQLQAASGRIGAGYDVKANVKARMSENTEDREEAMEERREAMQEAMEARKAAIEEHRENMRERLAAWKDKTKAEIAERIQDNLNALNARLTAHFDAQLDKMVSLMVRIEAGDTDNSGDADIEAANDAIVDAQEANDDQADNTYEVNVSTEANARVDVGAARKELHDDLKAVWDKVIAAREAVRKAATHVDKPAASANASAEADAE